MRQIDALEQTLNDNYIRAATWEKNGKARIYLNGYGRDIKAYIELDDPNRDVAPGEPLFASCILRVITDIENQPVQWILNRRKQIAHGIAQEMFAAGIFRGVSEEPICENWRDFILS